MKWFNLTVVAIWLTIFGTSSVPTNETMSDWHDAIVYEINNTFANYSWASPSDSKGEAIAMNDSAATQFYLRYTFVTMLFFVFALNIAFYAGRGDIRRLGGNIADWLHEKVWRQQILFRYLEYKSKKKTEGREREDTDRYHKRVAEQRQLG